MDKVELMGLFPEELTALLKEKGYAVQNAMAADLFPRCAHVESIVCLTQKQIKE